MFNVFLAFLTSNTSGSILSVALIKERNKTGFEYSVDGQLILTITITSSAFCASLCAASKDKSIE